MPVNLPNFQPLGFSQANPLAAGFLEGFRLPAQYQGMLEQQLSNQKSRELMPFIAPEARAALAARNIANTLGQRRVDYPGLGEGGLIGELAYMNMLSKNPQYSNIAEGQQAPQGGISSGVQNLFAQPSGNAEGQNFNPVDVLKNDIVGQINARNALSNYRQLGGARGIGGVGGQQHLLLQQYVQRENPEFTPEQVYDASNAYLEGRDALNDGTPLKPASGLVKSTLDQISTRGVPASITKQNILAEQADAEVKSLSSKASEWLKPYGDTYFGYNPQQIMDSFKKDDASQKKLGKFIAAQALQYDIAPARARLAGAQPGVSLTNELVNIAHQNIDARYPRLSSQAREYANNYINEALEEGKNARLSVGQHPYEIGRPKKVKYPFGSANEESSEGIENYKVTNDNIDPLGLR